MTVRELREEIEIRLLFKPQSALDLARIIENSRDARGSEVLRAVSEMVDSGWLREIDGKLYVDRDPPEAA